MPPSKQYQSESSRQPIWDKILRLVPHIKTELNYTTHFQLLIAVILSAQTTDRQVNNVTKKLFRNVTEAVDILNLGLKKLTISLSGINYFRTKAKHIFATAQMLRDNFGGVIPNDEKLLMKLP
jgi:endonuclease-3